MSRIYSQISTRLWNSKKFNTLSNDHKLLYLYFHSCSHVNSLGCYVVKLKYIEADLDWSADEVLKGIDSLSKALIVYNSDESLVKINNFLEHSPIQNKNHGIGAVRQVDLLPDCEEKYNTIKELASCKYADKMFNPEFLDTLSEGYRYTETDTEPEMETIPKPIPKKKQKHQNFMSKSKPTPPTDLEKSAGRITNSRVMNLKN